jgi:phosphoribosylformylglycinamidine (FGAM) synthase-like enzyme
MAMDSGGREATTAILPPSTKKEFQMIKSFWGEHPQHKQAHIKRCLNMFKAQSNDDNVWPKLPMMNGE